MQERKKKEDKEQVKTEQKLQHAPFMIFAQALAHIPFEYISSVWTLLYPFVGISHRSLAS